MSRVYADYNATAPVRPEVRAAVEPLLFGSPEEGRYGNASSVHWAGQEARRHLERARSALAEALGRRPSEVVFCSGGSEADNLALAGTLQHPACVARRLVVSAAEHPAVLGPADELARRGVDVVRVPVDAEGALDLDALRTALAVPTGLVAVMAVNNETGVITDMRAVHELTQAAGAPLLVDAVQAVGRVPLPEAELLVATGHKLGGLKGAGMLARSADRPLQPRIVGGPQERGMRAGTEDVAAAVALAEAFQIAQARRDDEERRLARLRDALEAGLEPLGARVVGARSPRVAGVSTLVFDGVEGDALLQAFDLEGIAASSGSACSSGSLEPSHVLSAMGYDPRAALSAVRFSFGWASTEADVERILDVAPEVLKRIRG